MPNREYELWKLIQELVGSAELWPYKVRRYFWTKNITHKQRKSICTFSFVNGLDPNILYEWAELKKLCRDAAAWRELHTLMDAFEEDPNRYRWWNWCVHMHRREYLNGDEKRDDDDDLPIYD